MDSELVYVFTLTKLDCLINFPVDVLSYLNWFWNDYIYNKRATSMYYFLNTTVNYIKEIKQSNYIIRNNIFSKGFLTGHYFVIQLL